MRHVARVLALLLGLAGLVGAGQAPPPRSGFFAATPPSRPPETIVIVPSPAPTPTPGPLIILPAQPSGSVTVCGWVREIWLCTRR